jgi:ribonuclease-3 family protein
MALSFLGDAVHSLFVREMLAAGGISKSGRLNDEARRYVTAEAQAEGARRVLPQLDEGEAEIYRRAHNSSHLNKPKHASGKDYRTATGFEALIGALTYIGDEERICELLDIACVNIGGENNDSED